MTKVLITGGNGFIGKHLTEYLHAKGLDVTTVDIKNPNRITPWKCISKNVRVYMKELDDAFKLRNLFGNDDPFDFIIHLAAIPTHGIALENPEHVLCNNIDNLTDVLGYCRNHPDTKLLFISSSSVVWSDPSFNPQAMSKQIGEQLLELYRNTYTIKCATVRLFNVYGPGENEYGHHTSLIRSLKKAVWLDQPALVHGDGSQTRDFTHVSDVVDGIWCIMSELLSETAQDVYELGTGGGISVEQIVNAFKGDDPLDIINIESRANDPYMTKADVTLWPKFWYPKINILEYIKKWKDEGSTLD